MTQLDVELPSLLTSWLPQQRWFAAKGRTIESVAVASATPLMTEGELLLDLVIVAVTFADAPQPQRYQLHVARDVHPRPALEHVAIGTIGDRVAYDGLFDQRVTDWLLDAFRSGTSVDGVRFLREPDADLAEGVHGRVLGVEQSNTSVSWGEKTLLKTFRLVQPGTNPDLEVHRALRSVSSTVVASLQGAVEGQLDGELVTLGMLQDFAANSADGWAMALASVRDLLAEADLRADEVGGDFAGESERLGETIATAHADLRTVLGESVRDPGDLVSVWHDRLTVVMGEIPELVGHEPAIRAVYDELTADVAPVPTQRVHGDLHLGQTLRTPQGWLVLDFEGEPAAPLAERVRPDTAMRDVAGMLFSFTYAAYHHILQSAGSLAATSEEQAQQLWHANEWLERNRAAFCDGYARRADADPREHLALLRAIELDKAVYQVLYETRSRPTWTAIPLAAIEQLTSSTSHPGRTKDAFIRSRRG